MKQTLIISILIIFTLNFSFCQDTIPNHNFENWYTNVHPENWETTNLLLPIGVNNCYRSENSFSGTYAISLETIDMDGLIVPGVATLGTLGFNNSTGGISFSAKPIALKGYYIHPSSGDEVLIGVEFFKDGVEIGDGQWTTTDSTGDYSEFVIPITFYSNQIPDTLNITILTDQYDVGSKLIVDNLEMEYQSTGVSSINDKNEVLCYPNPSSGIFTFQMDKMDDVVIQIYNMEGRLVNETQGLLSKSTIDLSNYRAGVYSAIVKKGNSFSIKKLILE